MEKCTHEIDAKMFFCQDKLDAKKRVIFDNPKRVKLRKIRIDGCVLKAGKRCDFLVIRKGVTAWFLELKGCNIEHGIEQLKATLLALKEVVRHLQVFCILVCRASPASGFVQKYAAKFARDTGALLKIRTRQAEVHV